MNELCCNGPFYLTESRTHALYRAFFWHLGLRILGSTISRIVSSGIDLYATHHGGRQRYFPSVISPVLQTVRILLPIHTCDSFRSTSKSTLWTGLNNWKSQVFLSLCSNATCVMTLQESSLSSGSSALMDSNSKPPSTYWWVNRKSTWDTLLSYAGDLSFNVS